LFSSADIGARFGTVRNHISPFPEYVVNIINYKPDVKPLWKKKHLLRLQNQIKQAADNQGCSYHDTGGFKHILNAQLSSRVSKQQDKIQWH